MSDRCGLVTPRISRVLSEVDRNVSYDSGTQIPPSPRESASSSTCSEAVSAALTLLEARRKGNLEAGWHTLHLSPDDYDTLLYDWCPDESELIVRMPSSIHDIFTELVVDEIKSQLRSIEQEKGETTSDVYLFGSQTADGKVPKRSPDAAIAHTASQYPSVVVETSYPQKQKLAKLADEYICGSDGNISVVLGFDIEYNRSKKASLSLWRPQVEMDFDKDEKSQIPTLEASNGLDVACFRSNDGKSIEDGTLQLQLYDFAPSACLASLSIEDRRATVVKLPYSTLCSFLIVAEKRHKTKMDRQGVQSSLLPNCRKRRREATPPETLSPGREAKFTLRERHQADIAEAEDTWL
ncbi:hypothetical protein MMC17_010114 [Xylographa soralifera]|nr:hypothetical protein [Xylographa soralifera]